MSTEEHGSEKAAQVETQAGVAGAGAGAGVGAKPPFGQRVKRHCARFWWLHLLILIAVVLVIVLPLIYVGYPKKAQNSINDAELEVTSQSLLNPAPDAFDLQIDSVFLTNSSLHANLDAWTGGLTLGPNDAPFVKIDVPATEAKNGTTVHVEQRAQIAAMDAFTNYTKTVLQSEEYSIFLRGKGGLKYGGLPKTTVDYSKKITMKGLNGLNGLHLTEFAIITTPQDDGANANGTVVIPNPSVATYALGNVTLAMSVKGQPVGMSTMNDVVLRPGNNTFPMRATTNQTAVVTLIFTDYKGGILPIDITGNTSVYNGQHLTYYEEALRSNTVTIQLDVIKALKEAGLAAALGINTTSTA